MISHNTGTSWPQMIMITIHARYYHPDIRKHVDNLHCDHCKCVKVPCKGMGKLPEYDITNISWYKVAVDLIGLWSAKTEYFDSVFYALMYIDTTTNLVELVHIDIKSSETIG